jgi:CheY-like chemotaxis protein
MEVYLPRTEGDAAADETPDSPVPGGSEVILLVEDEEIVRGIAETTLRQLGYRVLTAANGVEALHVAAAQQGRIDLLLTDVVMPHMGGDTLAEQFEQRYPDVLILFVSGYIDDTINPERFLRAGTQLLPKPYTPGTLARMVRKVLNEPRIAPTPSDSRPAT